MNPLAALEPERSSECLSDFAFDRWLSGEMSREETAALDAHAASCPRCAERRTRLLREHRDFHRFRRTNGSSALTARVQRRTAFGVAAGMVAMAAAALVMIRGGEAPSDTVRTKGARSIGFYVKRGDAVRRGAPGEVVAPGDALRFVYTSEQAGYLAVLSLDGARRASIYYPSASDRAAAIDVGREVPLPLSTVLDDVLGEETLFGVFCDRPIALEPLLRALEADARAAPPPGCSVDRLVIEKVKR